MKNLIGAALITMASLIPMVAGSQTLWGQARLGMSAAEVSRLYPEAKSAPLEPRRPEIKVELRMPFVSLLDIPSTVHFYFKDQGLFRVNVFVSTVGGFELSLLRYDELLQRLMSEHPAILTPESKRQLDQWRFLTDRWDTKEGVSVSLSLHDAISTTPAVLAVSTSGDGGAWSALEQKASLATITARRKFEETSYSERLERWVGKNVNQVASEWGAPTGITRMPNGEVIYFWEKNSADLTCRTSLFTKNRGLITKWQWSGNNCRRGAN